ncbi:hypothetical protein [Chitinophaga rhizosphaerae]|uniref:hypothetical protein n=1 Tax=Chitinophaga rhizosphaerae TaxID=1864947 RepID=UPI000F8033B4|nr:hypothetical protein [Chitinophaga rhizosphaerae]
MLLPNIEISDKLVQGFFKTKIADFVKQSLITLSANRELVKKFDPVIALMETSVSNIGDVPNPKPGVMTEYYKERVVKIADGHGLHTTISLVEKEYDAQKHEFKEKSVTKKGVLQFRRYDPVTVFASTGVFWGNTTLNGFGVDKDMKVTADDIQKDHVVTAAFLNFSFVPSKYASPLLQIGIDPTKKRPFMLLGGGLAVPVARLALTAGGIWTWQPRLDKLHENEVIESTTKLEQDIKYSFSGTPKGWYFGVQYNF